LKSGEEQIKIDKEKEMKIVGFWRRRKREVEVNIGG
jgi:hypothetical protein